MIKLLLTFFAVLSAITTQPKENTTVIAQIKLPEYEVYEVTAYTAGLESTGKRPGDPGYGITASGKKVKENHTIACPKSMEFGTKVYIPYFDTTFTCEDRGSAIADGKLDVYMPNLEDALEFGRRKLKVRILDKPWKGGERIGSQDTRIHGGKSKKRPGFSKSN